MMRPVEVSKERPAEAIPDLYGCEAVWVESVSVKETFHLKVVWEGVVQIFDLFGHPPASCRYAWPHVTGDKTGKRRFFAVLHQGPVDSPQGAVRDAIVAE